MMSDKLGCVIFGARNLRIQFFADFTQRRTVVITVMMPDRKMKGAIPAVIPSPILMGSDKRSISAEDSLLNLL